MKENDFYFPNTLDEPERFLFWTLDEAVVLLIPIVWGFLGSHSMLGLISSPLALWLYQRLKQPHGIEGLRAKLYWMCKKQFSQIFPVVSSTPRFFIG